MRGDRETNDSTIFVCVYIYIVIELDPQKCVFDNILKVIMSFNQSTLNEKNIRLNIALSLLEKDLHHLVLSLDRCGVPYRPASSTDKFASWFQSICCGINRVRRKRLKKVMTGTQVYNRDSI